MRRFQHTHESTEGPPGSRDSGIYRELSSRASSATLRFPRPRSFNFFDGRRERTDASIAQGLLKEEAMSNPLRQSPFNASPLHYSRQYLAGIDGHNDGHNDGPEHSIDQKRSRTDRNTSNTWTDSSIATEVEDEEDRTEFVREYNRLAQKHGVRKFVPDDYESTDVDTVTVTGKHGSWIMRKLLRRTSSMQTLRLKTDKQIRHKRSVSDFSNRLRMRREPLKDKTLKELGDICGRSLLYLPSDYAASSLSLPTCLRATAHYIVQHGTTARGIFRIPGSNSSTLTLYNYYATVDECADAICGTVRAPTLPEHLNYEVHDVASVFKKFLSGLPGGILQGSVNLFEALIAIQSHLHSDPEWTRTKQSKVRARLIALAIGSMRSRLQRELICAVFGLLCMIGRAAELAPREDERGRPLPTSGLMGYGALGVVFGPLLLGEALDSYEMRFAPGGLVTFPVTPTALPKDPKRNVTHRRKILDEMSYAASKYDKIKVANGITEMLITHWRDVVRHMRGLGVLKTTKDHNPGVARERRRSQLRPYASELFTLRKPPEWGAEESSIRRVQRTPSPPSPLQQRHLSQSEPGPGNQHCEGLRIRKQRSRAMPPKAPSLSRSKSIGALSPMVEEPAIEDQGEKTSPDGFFPLPVQVPRPFYRNRLPSNPALREAAERLKSPPAKEENVAAMTETSSLLAEVARGLREDAKKLMGARPDREDTKAAVVELRAVAELPSPPKAESTQDSKENPEVDASVIPLASELEKPELDKPNKPIPQPEIQSLGEAQKDAAVQEGSSPKSTKENASRLRLFRDPSPRSNARSFFEKTDQDSTISKASPGHQDQDSILDSPDSKVSLSSTRPWSKKGKFVADPSATVETPFVPPQEQVEVVVTVSRSPKSNNARQYFEKADQERNSAEKAKSEMVITDKVKVASPPLRNRRTSSPTIQGAPESKNYTPTRFRVIRSESPLRSETRRSSTPEPVEVAQPGSNPSTDRGNPIDSNLTSQDESPKPLGKLDQTPSPHRLALLRYEKWAQNQGLAKTPGTQLPPEIPPRPLLRNSQSFVASRIRGLQTSDPGSQKPESKTPDSQTPDRSGPPAVPSTNQTVFDVIEPKKIGSGSLDSPAISAKDEEVPQADNLTPSVVASAVQPEAQDDTSIETVLPDSKSSESPLSPAVVETPVASRKDFHDLAEEPLPGHEIRLTDVETPFASLNEFPDLKEPSPAHENRPTDVEGGNQVEPVEHGLQIPKPKSKRRSDDQNSDASNVTVISFPKKRAQVSEQFVTAARSSSDCTSDDSSSTIRSPSKRTGHMSFERPALALTENLAGAEHSPNSSAGLSSKRIAYQTQFAEVTQDHNDSDESAKSAPKSPETTPQAQSTQTPEKRPPVKGMRGGAGSVLALAAKFNNAAVSQTSPLSSPPVSPVTRMRPRGLIRPSLFQPADRLVSTYTQNPPSPTKSTYPERSDIRTVRNPLPVDRRPVAQPQRTTPQKEISPLYRTPRNGGMKEEGSPSSPLSYSNTPTPPIQSVSSKKRNAFDGNYSLTSPPETRAPRPQRPSLRTTERSSQDYRESLGGARTSSLGTVLPHPITEPPVDQHISFIRPPSTPRRIDQDQDRGEIIRVVTPSGNAALYEQIRKLQRQLESATEELAQYKRQVESRGNLQDLGTLSEQLRESKREVRSWRARAELAERRLLMLEGIKGRFDGDGTRDIGDGVGLDNSEASAMAVFNFGENKGKTRSRKLGEATDFGTQSTDTEVWVRGGTATVLRQRERVKDSVTGGGEEKLTVGDMVMGMRGDDADLHSPKSYGKGGEKGKGKAKGKMKRVEAGFGSEWSLLGEIGEFGFQ